MNARTLPFNHVRLLVAGFDHGGLALDLHGYIDEDGYSVSMATIPGTMTSVGCDDELLCYFGGKLDDTLPSAAELRRQSRAEMRIEHVVSDKYWLTH